MNQLIRFSSICISFCVWLVWNTIDMFLISVKNTFTSFFFFFENFNVGESFNNTIEKIFVTKHKRLYNEFPTKITLPWKMKRISFSTVAQATKYYVFKKLLRNAMIAALFKI